MDNIDNGLGGVFGEAIGEFGSVFVRGELLDPRNDFVRNQVPVGVHIDI